MYVWGVRLNLGLRGWMHCWLLSKDTHVYIYTQMWMCTGWNGHGAPSEGRSLTEWSAALPDPHVKQAALTPPLLHSCLFPHVVILSAPPPPISIILTLSPSIHTGLVLCLSVTAASLSFSLSPYLYHLHQSQQQTKQMHKKALSAFYSIVHSALV